MSTVNLDSARLAAAAAQTTAQDSQIGIFAKKAASALLAGSALNVTDARVSDLEALVARLRNEQAQVRFSLLLTSLSAVGQSLDENQKQRLEQGLALSKKLDELQKTLEGATAEESKAKADALLLQAKIEQLQKQIEQAVQDGKEHNELVAEQKRVREELEAKEKTAAEAGAKIAEVKNEISSVKGKISAIVNEIGENTLRTIAKEIAELAGPEEAERPAETAKAEEKELQNDPINAIRDSLDRIERDLAEAVESNRIETV